MDLAEGRQKTQRTVDVLGYPFTEKFGKEDRLGLEMYEESHSVRRRLTEETSTDPLEKYLMGFDKNFQENKDTTPQCNKLG